MPPEKCQSPYPTRLYNAATAAEPVSPASGFSVTSVPAVDMDTLFIKSWFTKPSEENKNLTKPLPHLTSHI